GHHRRPRQGAGRVGGFARRRQPRQTDDPRRARLMDFLLSAKVAAIFLLILGNAFFVASEIALTSARRSRIAQLASEGNGSARIVQTLHANPERFYSVTQIGITLMSLALGAIGIQTFTEALDPPVVQALTHLSFLGERVDSVLTSEPFAHTTAQVLAFLIV